MLTPAHLTLLRRAFVDVCRGYSTGRYQDRVLYIKHLSHTDHLSCDDLQESYRLEAIKQGAQTEADRLATLIGKGAWSVAREDEIARQRDTVMRFEEGKKVMVVPSMIRNQEKQIEAEKTKLDKMLVDRSTQMGITAEVYSQQRLNDHYIINNLYKDSGLTDHLFTETSFEDFNDSEVEEIMKVYKTATEPCEEQNLRWLSVQPFFVSYYAACDNDLAAFFGRPVVEMTYHQIRLGGFSRYYKSLMESTDMSLLPVEDRSNPDRLEQRLISQKNGASMRAEGKTPTNMTKEDIKEMGLEGQMSKLPSRNMSFTELLAHVQKQPKQ